MSDYKLVPVARAIWEIRREWEDRCDMELEDLSPDHSVWGEAKAALQAILDAATAVQGEPVAYAMLVDEFSAWWEEFGQFVRSGGGDYERTFAFEAWRHLYPQLMRLTECPDCQGHGGVETPGYSRDGRIHVCRKCGGDGEYPVPDVAGLVDALDLALEYWRDRQQRYKNRRPKWVIAAESALAAHRKQETSHDNQ